MQKECDVPKRLEGDRQQYDDTTSVSLSESKRLDRDDLDLFFLKHNEITETKFWYVNLVLTSIISDHRSYFIKKITETKLGHEYTRKFSFIFKHIISYHVLFHELSPPVPSHQKTPGARSAPR